MHVLTDVSVTFSETVLIELPLVGYSTDHGEVRRMSGNLITEVIVGIEIQREEKCNSVSCSHKSWSVEVFYVN